MLKHLSIASEAKLSGYTAGDRVALIQPGFAPETLVDLSAEPFKRGVVTEGIGVTITQGYLLSFVVGGASGPYMIQFTLEPPKRPRQNQAETDANGLPVAGPCVPPTPVLLDDNDDGFVMESCKAYFCDTTAATFTVNVPAPEDGPSIVYVSNRGTNPLDVEVVGGGTIDGSATLTLAAQFDSAVLISDGRGDWGVF